MVRRLPWVEELPSALTATMRPKPVMIPVNILIFSQGTGPFCPRSPINVYDCHLGESVGPQNPGHNSNVWADCFG
jgi:hypothetical protein